MNCDDFGRMLSESTPLSAVAGQHIRSCEPCRKMLSALAGESVDAASERLALLQAQVTTDLKPVKPLPSDRVLVAGFTLLAVVFALAVSLVSGHKGFLSLSVGQRAAYYGVIVLTLWCCSQTAVKEGIPGSRRLLRQYSLFALCGAALIAVVGVTFPHFALSRFVPLGIPCVSLGIASGVLAGLLLWRLVRRGYFWEPTRAGIIVGTFCGLAGLAVLAIHCPFQNATHILVWHVGAVLVVAAVGGAIGRLTPAE